MEIASDVRDLVVGVQETLDRQEAVFVEELQALHGKYLTMMDEFSTQVAELALTISPEARIFAFRLRQNLIQDWRSVITERLFRYPSEQVDIDATHLELTKKLEDYSRVIANFIQVGQTQQEDAILKFECPEYLSVHHAEA